MRFVSYRSIRVQTAKERRSQGTANYQARDLELMGAIREPMTATERRHQGLRGKERRNLVMKPRVCRTTVAYGCSSCNGTLVMILL